MVSVAFALLVRCKPFNSNITSQQRQEGEFADFYVPFQSPSRRVTYLAFSCTTKGLKNYRYHGMQDNSDKLKAIWAGEKREARILPRFFFEDDRALGCPGSHRIQCLIALSL
jgi:hypothetical protein